VWQGRISGRINRAATPRIDAAHRRRASTPRIDAAHRRRASTPRIDAARMNSRADKANTLKRVSRFR
jgi:hypothetical protein